MSWNDDGRSAGSGRTVGPMEQSAREEAIRRWAKVWRPLDAETLDLYVSATLDEPVAVLSAALARLVKHHDGERPAPAKVVSTCWLVSKEQREKAAEERVRIEPPRLSNVTKEAMLRSYDEAIVRARAEGYPEDSGRIDFWKRNRARLVKRWEQRPDEHPMQAAAEALAGEW